MDPDPDPTPYSSVTKDAKKENFFIFFSYTFSGTLSSVLKIIFFVKILCENPILQAFFQSAQHLYEKKEGSGSGAVPQTNGSGSGS